MQLRRFGLADLCVLIAIVAILVALSAPYDLRSYIDSNPDNSFPMTTVDPTVLKESDALGSVRVFVTSRTRNDRGNWDLKCLLLNTGTTPIFYDGYSPTYYHPRLKEGVLIPLYRKQVERESKWEEVRAHRCGSGSVTMRLKPGQAGRFHAWHHGEEPAIRIGVSYGATAKLYDAVVWSVAIPTIDEQ